MNSKYENVENEDGDRSSLVPPPRSKSMTRFSRTVVGGGATLQRLVRRAFATASSSPGRDDGWTDFHPQRHHLHHRQPQRQHRSTLTSSPSLSTWFSRSVSSSGGSADVKHADGGEDADEDASELEGWETVVGLELHVQVAANTKLFSGYVTVCALFQLLGCV